MKKLNKGAFITDIHFGKKSNSVQHNEDCLRCLRWFSDEVKKDPTIDYIGFLGDWHENRSALNISTLNYSYEGAKILNEIGLPVYFLIGNHDLYHRHTREVHSVVPFNEFKNFTMIDQPTVVDDVLFVPFLFPEEYPSLMQYNNIPTWAGHFEFKGFQITGYGMVMPTGPDPADFTGPDRIFSGHFHKRQWSGNIVYIGNCFPMDFSDADDDARGMMTYTHKTKETEFTNWAKCPKYVRTTLSDVMDECVDLLPDSTVECMVDIEISFDEMAYLRQTFIDKYKLRDLQLEEEIDLAAISDTETDINVEGTTNTNDLVVEMLTGVESNKIDNNMLIEIYRGIQTQ